MKYPELSPIIEAINTLLLKKRPIVVAFDGHSGSGKSTLTKALVEELGAVRIDQDDFYRGGSYAKLAAMSDEQRADYEIDWQRMRQEVLTSLLEGKSATYHPFDWNNQEETALSSQVIEVAPTPIIIIDGVFSSRSELADVVDFTVLVRLDREIRKAHLSSREGDGFKDPINSLWDKAESYYLEHVRPLESFDIVVDR